MENRMTPYEEWQIRSYGNILPDAASNCTAEELQEAGLEELERLAEWTESRAEMETLDKQ